MECNGRLCQRCGTCDVPCVGERGHCVFPGFQFYSPNTRSLLIPLCLGVLVERAGHVDGFSDPMVDCKETKLRFRADQLYYAPIRLVHNTNDERMLGYVCVQEANDEDMVAAAVKQARTILKASNVTVPGSKNDNPFQPFKFVELTEADAATLALVPSPATGKPGTLTPPRDFNLMFETQVGAAVDASSKAYLRPETAQGIFLNFKNVATSSRLKIPFGIAQQGKAFRNEITPRNFIFRSREFEQMEVEYFIPPGNDVWPPIHEQWIADSEAFLLSTGLRPEFLGRDVHLGSKLAHYAVACTDITFQFPFGTQELMGIAARGNYDLTQHSIGSGKSTDHSRCDFLAVRLSLVSLWFLDCA
jgi:glycyl-tRNA synthetase